MLAYKSRSCLCVGPDNQQKSTHIQKAQRSLMPAIPQLGKKQTSRLQETKLSRVNIQSSRQISNRTVVQLTEGAWGLDPLQPVGFRTCSTAAFPIGAPQRTPGFLRCRPSAKNFQHALATCAPKHGQCHGILEVVQKLPKAMHEDTRGHQYCTPTLDSTELRA